MAFSALLFYPIAPASSQRRGAALAALLLLLAPATSSLTFYTASDTHLGHDVGNITSLFLNTVTIDNINLLAACGGAGVNCSWPASLGGGPVAAPRAVVVSGDLIDNGNDASGDMVKQWMNWTALYGFDGTDGRLHFPVYESRGNHDGCVFAAVSTVAASQLSCRVPALPAASQLSCRVPAPAPPLAALTAAAALRTARAIGVRVAPIHLRLHPRASPPQGQHHRHSAALCGHGNRGAQPAAEGGPFF